MIIFLLLIAASVVFWVVAYQTGSVTASVFAAASTIAAAVSTIIILLNIALLPEYIEKNQQRYDSLVAQRAVDYGDYGNKQLADQITDWNEDLAGIKAGRANPWVSWYYMDLDGFDFIPLPDPDQQLQTQQLPDQQLPTREEATHP